MHYPGEAGVGREHFLDVAVAGENVYAVGGQRVFPGNIDDDFLTLALWR